ncbi:MAG: acetyl-CoA carboxylase carboxyltransferase subunit beta [Nitrospirae bacterium]|nr:MAG: acetyl-CoA carboxylase carboxyltransferase subunit beta [Nitrospirota bacterium]
MKELNSVKIPEGLWIKCNSCREIVYKKEVVDNFKICPKCNYHFRLNPYERIDMLIDKESFKELGRGLVSEDPLGFEDLIPYRERLKRAMEKTQLEDAAVCGTATISGYRVVLFVMDFSFMGGSMGCVVGEKFTLSAEYALEHKIPLISIASSGGARMQEGILSLMQMAKTAATVSKLKEEGVLYISILSDPTFGGVTASFAMLGDIIIAEPNSLIGFAGPRVIEQTIKQKLPEGFQKTDFHLKHGMVDMVVPRKDLRKRLSDLLCFFLSEKKNKIGRENGDRRIKK